MCTGRAPIKYLRNALLLLEFKRWRPHTPVLDAFAGLYLVDDAVHDAADSELV